MDEWGEGGRGLQLHAVDACDVAHFIYSLKRVMWT